MSGHGGCCDLAQGMMINNKDHWGGPGAVQVRDDGSVHRPEQRCEPPTDSWVN